VAGIGTSATPSGASASTIAFITVGVAATPTVMNATLDALAPLGVADVAMPATPERIWQAIRAAKAGKG